MGLELVTLLRVILTTSREEYTWAVFEAAIPNPTTAFKRNPVFGLWLITPHHTNEWDL